MTEPGEVVGLLGFEFSGSYPLWFAVGAPDWMSDEWLDDEDKHTNWKGWNLRRHLSLRNFR